MKSDRYQRMLKSYKRKGTCKKNLLVSVWSSHYMFSNKVLEFISLFTRCLNRAFGSVEMRNPRKKGLSEWLSSKLFNRTETVVDEIQNENQAREEERQNSSEETGSEVCPHSFGYLRTLPRNDPIPDECLICKKVMQCMNRHVT